jgi:hypothetical protein
VCGHPIFVSCSVAFQTQFVRSDLASLASNNCYVRIAAQLESLCYLCTQAYSCFFVHV